MKYCAKCGTQMEDEAKQCPQCNFPVFEPSNLESKQVKSPRKKINKQLVIIPTAIIVTAIATFAITSSVLSKNPKETLAVDNVSSVETTIATEAIAVTIEPEKTVPVVTEAASVSSYATGASNAPCPAQEYGNHSWSEATCESPAKCRECGAYKDEKLGNHYWQAANCIEPMQCFWCNAYKDENGELGNHDFFYKEDLQDAKCQYCNMLLSDYKQEKE